MAKRYTYRHQDNSFYGRMITALVIRRHLLGISQDDLNEALGFSDRLISKWESGDRRPSAFAFSCWAEGLGINHPEQLSLPKLIPMEISDDPRDRSRRYRRAGSYQNKPSAKPYSGD
ncbi:MAG: helix-turn-helix domain-containing protein [Rhodospirillales bacterium]